MRPAGAPGHRTAAPRQKPLIKTLEGEILLRLLEEIPGQPSAEALKGDKFLHRFTLVFDREGYSPDFFARLKAKRVAILTYHKLPGPDWEQSEFTAREVALQNGDIATLLLAERGTLLSSGLWVRELRRLDETGHQTSILSTDYRGEMTAAAASMFARAASGKLLQIHAGTLRIGPLGRAWDQSASRHHAPGQPRLASP